MSDPVTGHLEKLVKMHSRANITALYGSELRVAPGEAEVSIEVTDKFFHSAGTAHASFYFKALDDAAWFAAATLEEELFVLTVTLTTYVTRPISSGRLRAVGKVVNRNNTQFIVESVAYDEAGREVARASGIIVKSKIPLATLAHYSE